MSEPGYQRHLPNIIDVGLLGDYDAMVVMRSKDRELGFVIRRDMPEEGFIRACQKLRELVFAE